MRVFGYNFPINEASAAIVCSDKAACSEILTRNGIPCVQHDLFIRPLMKDYVAEKDVFTSLLQKAQEISYPLVAKINNGTGGIGVFRVDNDQELKTVAVTMFDQGKDICLSSFYNILNEFRVIVLEGKIQLVFNKIRPSILGDGKRTFNNLVLEFLFHRYGYDSYKDISLLSKFNNFSYKPHDVVEKGKRVQLNWKHNLNLGSAPKIIHPNDKLYNEISDLAIRATQVTSISFASVDIIQIENKANPYKVIEINSGIMMENFIRLNQKEGYNLAKKIYQKATHCYFDI